MKFLKELPITNEEAEKLEKLAVETPAALYGLISTSIDEFAEFFGKSRMYHLIRHLYPMLSDEEKSALASVNALEIKKRANL